MDWSIRPLLLALALSLAAAVPLPQTALAETIKVSLVQTNDIDRMEEADGRGGFARLAAVVAAERARGNVIFVHSGDTISPSLLSGIDKGAHIIDILNHLDVDVMVPGNHEFDFGPEVFQQRISEATFPIVASNIVMPAGGGPANTAPDKIVEVEGIKLGFYGLTTEDTTAISSPGDIAFLDPVETGIDAAEDLRARGADIVVAVTHLPVDDDLALARADAADINLAGHDEHLLTLFDGRHVLTESGAQGEYVVVTDLTIERTERDGKVSVSWKPTFRIIDTRDLDPDPEIAALVKGYADKLDEELGVEIGTTEAPLDSRRATVRVGEAAIGNLVADAMRTAVDAEVAFTNGGGIRADREYPAGARLTRKDILSELPFGNKTVKLELTGALLREAIENGFAAYPALDGRNPHVSGMVVTVDLGKPPGERVQSIAVGGAPLDPAKTYTAATNDYLARGGNDYVVLLDASTLIGGADAKLMASDVIDYITARGTVAPAVEGRIVME
jgi:2',3'-cyclic-nucleotide 2'-phosphodiesterase (5'-nucleotidase family)